MTRLRSLRLAGTGLVLLALHACGTDPAAGLLPVCAEDLDCSGQQTCVEGQCVVPQDAGGQTGVPDTLSPLPTRDTTPPHDADAEDTSGTDGDTTSQDGAAGSPCTTDTECDGGFCIRTREGQVCTEPCRDVCPLDWECRLLANSAGDAIQLCVPPQRILCRPCLADIDCDGLANRCLEQLDGRFCGTTCTGEEDCPSGYRCQPIPVPGQDPVPQCVPTLGVCGNCLDQDGDGYGEGPGCEGPDCDDLNPAVYPGAPEACDGLDNNCNDQVDEDFDFSSSLDHCGACNRACTAPAAQAACQAGTCGIAQCPPGFVDLNGLVSDGCEYFCLPNPITSGVEVCNGIDDNCDGLIDEDFNLATDPANCGSCGVACVAAEVATGVCQAGTCRVETCTPDRADCNALFGDGCEVELLNDDRHCGRCANVCGADGAATSCQTGVCRIASCLANTGDCNGVFEDGCETDTRASFDHCGGCGTSCEREGSVMRCEASRCQVSACLAPRADCDGIADNGCETDTSSSLLHCGACGSRCTLPNAVMACEASTCTFLRCQEGFIDLDGDPASGCEYACVPQPGPDVPDDAFTDSDCDGIDGTIARGVFVRASACSDANPGTPEAPLCSLPLALGRAADAGRDVYIAGGNYALADTLLLRNGVSIWGGYSGTGWQRTSAAVVNLNVAQPTGVLASNLSAATTLDRLTINAGAGTASQPSSYAVRLDNTTGLTLRNCLLRAGDGLRGNDGTSPAGTAASGDAGVQGVPGCEDSGIGCTRCSRPQGAAGGASTCGGTGGRGGNAGGSGNSSGFDGSRGTAGAFRSPVGGEPGPGTPAKRGNWDTPALYWGQPGGNGLAAEEGSAGAAGWNALGWSPTPGTAGGRGGDGSGGGGGGGGGGGDTNCNSYGGSGGGGGGGGCGGTGAEGGQPGGASVALFASSSLVRVIQTNLISGRGGQGGAGGNGQPGGSGGAGGPRNNYGGGTEQDDGSNGGPGGRGGNGARGGHGGGAPGGPSVCIVLFGTSALERTDSPCSRAQGGTGGPSQAAGASGPSGVSVDVLTP
jgi:hypothetical protein